MLEDVIIPYSAKRADQQGNKEEDVSVARQ
jgi:hypothetical protein